MRKIKQRNYYHNESNDGEMVKWTIVYATQSSIQTS